MEKIFAEYGWKINVDKLTLMEVPIETEKLNGASIYGYDWVEKEQAEKIKNMAQNDTYQWMYSYKPCEKRLRLTSQYLMEAESKEIKTAVFIYSLLMELDNIYSELWAKSGSYKYIENLQDAAWLALPSEYRWHHNMKKLLPDLGITKKLLRNIVIDKYNIIFDIANIVLNHIVNNYTILYYYTLKIEDDKNIVNPILKIERKNNV